MMMLNQEDNAEINLGDRTRNRLILYSFLGLTSTEKSGIDLCDPHSIEQISIEFNLSSKEIINIILVELGRYKQALRKTVSSAIIATTSITEGLNKQSDGNKNLRLTPKKESDNK